MNTSNFKGNAKKKRCKISFFSPTRTRALIYMSEILLDCIVVVVLFVVVEAVVVVVEDFHRTDTNVVDEED